MANLNCKMCKHVGEATTFKPAVSAYHDFYCPECGSSYIDTSELNKEWAEQGRHYGYGDDNVLTMKKDGKPI